MDFRLKENRKEAFIRWYLWSIEYKDCDPAVWMTNYLNERYEHNDEQKLWFCWLYGNTYYLPTSWVLINEFPDFELATEDRITQWNIENRKRLRYQQDTKRNSAGHLDSMFSSYKKFMGNSLQRNTFEKYYGDNEIQTFNNLWKVVKINFHKFGRYSAWFYLQHLKHTANISMEPSSLMLDEFKPSRSHRNGLLLALGRDDEYNKELTKLEYKLLEGKAKDLLEETKSRKPELASEIDLFTMETCLCSFKKIFRNSRSRFLGYYLMRQHVEIETVSKDGWYGIDWDVLYQARKECLDQRLLKLDSDIKNDFLTTGNIYEPWERGLQYDITDFF